MPAIDSETSAPASWPRCFTASLPPTRSRISPSNPTGHRRCLLTPRAFDSQTCSSQPHHAPKRTFRHLCSTQVGGERPRRILACASCNSRRPRQSPGGLSRVRKCPDCRNLHRRQGQGTGAPRPKREAHDPSPGGGEPEVPLGKDVAAVGYRTKSPRRRLGTRRCRRGLRRCRPPGQGH